MQFELAFFATVPGFIWNNDYYEKKMIILKNNEEAQIKL
jgi:hypothetical protein